MVEHSYIHIPFCKRKCNYCSFVSGIDLGQKSIYINSLLKQITKEYNGEKLKTLYLGGGTPSLLDVNDISSFLSIFNFQKNAEITLEVNPETVVKEKFDQLYQLGINRISLGVQSFNNDILDYIGRKHTSDIIFNTIKILKNIGFSNISIDLIYGLPFQTFEILKDDLKKVIELDVQHVSLYGLKIEENSFFYKNKPQNLPNDEIQADMFLYICDFLKNNGFIHYEISNFSKLNFESKHNTAYWNNKEYYGFGLNASGYIKNKRYTNFSNFNEYVENPLGKDEENILSIQETMENEIFLSLRLKNGVNIEQINKRYNINFLEKYKSVIKKYSDLKLLEIKENNCSLTEKGILLSNNIMCEFIE